VAIVSLLRGVVAAVRKAQKVNAVLRG